MIAFSRKLDESISISSILTVKVLGIRGNRVSLGVDTFRGFSILRGEIEHDNEYDRVGISRTASEHDLLDLIDRLSTLQSVVYERLEEVRSEG